MYWAWSRKSPKVVDFAEVKKLAETFFSRRPAVVFSSYLVGDQNREVPAQSVASLYSLRQKCPSQMFQVVKLVDTWKDQVGNGLTLTSYCVQENG